jgi:uncharacterized protein
MQQTGYTVYTNKKVHLRIALVSDLHNAPYAEILPSLRGVNMIAVTGDLVDKYSKGYERGIAFLKEAVSIAPTFYSLGNHEGLPDMKFIRKVKDTGAVLLDNQFIHWRGIVVAGLSHKMELKLLRDLSKQEGFKLLLCHHPEYYPKYIKGHDIDLTLAGHAHGGQIRLFGHGLYAPGQGWFPKLTSGVHDGRMVISRGASNVVPVPRLFNRCETVIVKIVSTGLS